MNIELCRPAGQLDWLRLYLLYRRAFPRSERKPFAVIHKLYGSGRADVWCIQSQGKFSGLATTVNSDKWILLDYFAVISNQRGHGIGTKAMGLLLEKYRDRGLFLEIESTREECPDRALRVKRKQFYLACGLEDFGTEAEVFDVRMELLGLGCRLNYEDYRDFYRTYHSPWAAEHIKPVGGEAK